MADVVIGAAVGAVFNVGLEKLLGVIKMAAKCESDCLKLLSDLENHRPKLERIEIQLRNRTGEPLEALEEWLAESKEIRQLARLVVQEGLSRSKAVKKFSFFGNRDLVKRIQEIRGKIDELCNGTSATTAILSTILATRPTTNNPAANTVCTHQLHHCCSSPGLMQAPSPVARSHHTSHSLPPLLITYSPSSPEPAFMSQHSSPVSGHGTPGSSSVYSDHWGQQSPAPGSPNTWDSRLDHHMHSRSEEEVVSITNPELGQTQGMYRRNSADHFATTYPGSRQWFDEVAGFQDAERRTREAQSHHRRHSITNSPQSFEPATLKTPSLLAWSHHASHSLPPLRTTYSSSSLADPSMSQHSSPVSGHGIPGPSSSPSVTYLDWSEQSPAPGSVNSWDAPGSSPLQHSRSEGVVGIINPELEQIQGLHNSMHQSGTTCQGSQQWLDEVARTLDADWRTLEAQSHHRRHSIADSLQSSELDSALPLHSAPSKARMMYSPVDLISL